jgi:anti-sigma factor RsiW
MNCELVHEQIVTAAYGELPDEQVRELELHLADCPECQQERKQLLALKALAEAYPVVEPDANLVARARLRLDEALDALPPKRWHERLGQWMRNNFASLQAAPVAACLLLVDKLKAASENFVMVDGPDAGKEFIQGRIYDTVPSEYLGKFDVIPEEPAGTANAE